jgi:DNA-binding Lrp family transcriptional regulator
MAMKNPKTKPLDWAKLLTNEARLTDILAADEIAEKYKLHVTSVWKALSRLEDRGLVSRVSKGIYVNKLVRDNSPLDFVRALRTDSYVSLESALTCVTLGKPKEYKTSEFTITFRTISEQLFWGFVEKQTRYSTYKIAEPEKALLDWIYLSLQGGLTPELDEIDFKRLDKQRLVKYADKFPNTVRNILVHSLAFEHFAA